jgi:hypothetical protein
MDKKSQQTTQPSFFTRPEPTRKLSPYHPSRYASATTDHCPNIVGNGGNLNMNTKCVIIIKWFWFFNNCKWIILVYSFMNKVYLFNKFLLDVSVDKFWLDTFVNDRNLSLRYRKTIIPPLSANKRLACPPPPHGCARSHSSLNIYGGL